MLYRTFFALLGLLMLVQCGLAQTQPSFHRHEEFSEIRFWGPPSDRVPMTTSKVQGSPEPPLDAVDGPRAE
jgi:hypothetical protein